MDAEDKKLLTDYFRSYISSHKQELFEKVLDQRTRHLTVVLENIYQPQNASAVLRTAECFGVQDVHIIENEYPFNPNKNVVLGAAKWLSLYRYNENDFNTPLALDQIKRKNYKIYAAHPQDSSLSIYDLNIKKPFALLFGTEKTGLSQTALEKADALFHIPMHGFTESFNISVSAAISLSILKQRLEEENIDYHLKDKDKDELRLLWYKKMVKSADIIEQRFLENKKFG